MIKNKRKKEIPALAKKYTLIDTHCHLDMNAYQSDLSATLASAHAQGVRIVVTIGIDKISSQKAVQLATQYDMVKATVGVHPHDVATLQKEDLREISGLIESCSAQIVGYGEIGLDYAKRYSSPEVQKRWFKNQLSLAKEHGLPVIIHDRDAHLDMIQILKEFSPFDCGGIMHCFSGDLEFAKNVIDLGFHISIPGIVTFKNARELQEVAQKIPLETLLLETDGPFLAPAPYRGKRNEPLYLLYTAAEVARLRGTSLEEIAEATTANATRLFNFSLTSEANA